jgi:hypothetical protein
VRHQISIAGSYGEMRTLAQHKFDLWTVDPQLPSQTLEQVGRKRELRTTSTTVRFAVCVQALFWVLRLRRRSQVASRSGQRYNR